MAEIVREIVCLERHTQEDDGITTSVSSEPFDLPEGWTLQKVANFLVEHGFQPIPA